MRAGYDVIVVGLGAMGSAIAARCALRGARVLGLEQFAQGNDLGSFAGRTRIIRQAYYEDAAYVPLLLRAYELWDDLERRSGADVRRECGLLMCGAPESEVIAGSLRAAREHGLDVAELSAKQLRARYPSLAIASEEVGVFERRGGALFSERAVRAHQDVARSAGADLRFECAMRSWSSDGATARVETAHGDTVEAPALVIAAGAWFGSEFAALGIRLEVQRNVQVWFEPSTAAYRAEAFPAFLLDRAGLEAPLYGFPDFGDGVKAALHGFGAVTRPDELERGTSAADVAPVRHALDAWMPGSAARYRRSKVCMYALTPDRNFVIDRHPAYENVVLCGGFSGHGFKFSSVVGELVTALALGGAVAYDIAFLSLRRFANGLSSGYIRK